MHSTSIPTACASGILGSTMAGRSIGRPRSAKTRLTGEQRLGWALVADAFAVRAFTLRYPNNKRAQQQMQRDWDWLFNGAVALLEAEDVFTMLGLPSDAVREAYLKLTGKVRHKASNHG
jgi:hypothetical protein